jgi:hypothetical protein
MSLIDEPEMKPSGLVRIEPSILPAFPRRQDGVPIWAGWRGEFHRKAARDGCWPSMAPDDSYVSWTFDGPHRNLILTRAGEEESWTINVSGAPGVNDFEVYHPRWSNDVRYMVMTGPYTAGDKKIKLWDGADGVEIYIGKFNKDFRGMDGWLKLTKSRVGEFFPDLWIAGGENRSSKFGTAAPASSKAANEPQPAHPASYDSTWPGSRSALLFQWRDNKDNGQFVDGSGKTRNVRLHAEGGARFGPNGEMHIPAACRRSLQQRDSGRLQEVRPDCD